jgi:hypothetical protein
MESILHVIGPKKAQYINHIDNKHPTIKMKNESRRPHLLCGTIHNNREINV